MCFVEVAASMCVTGFEFAFGCVIFDQGISIAKMLSVELVMLLR